MSPQVAGAALGLLAAGGIVIAAASSPPLRRVRLADRLAPYLHDPARPSRLLGDRAGNASLPGIGNLLTPVMRELAARVDRLIGGSASVRARLEQAGRETGVEEFRMEQVLWAAGGLAGGLLVAVVAELLGGGPNPLVLLALAAGLAVAGLVVRDRLLTTEVRRREARMTAELPTIAELLALAVAAGEGAAGALERVVRLSRGDLASELRRALADTRTGASMVVALDRLAARASLPALSRFVDGMAIAVERGTPLADVLRAQAADVRAESRRALLEVGGRKEIAMLVPVVFLVLPVTVVFALFPGFYSLRLAVP